jgi:hypothetical protein
MTMKLAKTASYLAAVMALSLFVAGGIFAQTPAPAHKKATPKSKVAAPARPVADKADGAAAAAPVAEKVETGAKRDPFSPLINQHKDEASNLHLPPGKAGLVVATVRVDGAVKSSNGMMIAILSNPEQHVYFVREGDRLYDGEVEKIGLDGVTFRENSKDAFGKPIDRMVTKRIYASAGEQQ